MQSIWRMNNQIPSRSALQGDLRADVAIVGAGLTGILCAYLLKEKNINAVILEANQIASGVTQNTTAKITAQHNLIYDRLLRQFGEEKARQYANANLLAIEKYASIVEQNGISCDFERMPAFVYTLNETKKIEKEVKAALALGIHAEFTQTTALPFQVAGAIKFHNQAKFDPLTFINAIAQDLTIFENTPVSQVHHRKVVTDKGIVYADKVIIATHFPFLNVPGYYFARMYQERSYVLALEDAAQLDGMYIDHSTQGYSFRNHRHLLLLGGESHRTGQNPHGGCYERLAQAAQQYYPESKVVTQWSTQDCMTLDGVPYIGNYSSDSPDLFVATGYQKWGMTSSMVAAMILTDKITMHDNPNQDVFSPKRFTPTASMKELLTNSGQAVSSLAAQNLTVPKETIAHLSNGQGGIVSLDGKKMGVYKDKQGTAHIVTTKCPHLGCQLDWNPDELSWDCPCHGSRFTYQGELINNPALRGLRGTD